MLEEFGGDKGAQCDLITESMFEIQRQTISEMQAKEAKANKLGFISPNSEGIQTANDLFRIQESDDNVEDNINDSIPLPESADEMFEQSRLNLNPMMAQLSMGQNLPMSNLFAH